MTDQLKKILLSLDGLPPEELPKALEAVLFVLIKLQKENEEKIDDIKQIAETTKKLKGEKGDSPTTEELLALIKPLIPEPIKPQDGKTPTKKELLDLIKPLIPKPIPGKNGQDAPTLKEILANIPKPKDGKDGKTPDITELIKEIRDRLSKMETRIKEIPERPVQTFFGPGKTKIYLIDLSSLLDGVTKTFFIGSHFGIISVQGSSAPFGAFRPTIDYIEDGALGRSITFTSAVDASLSLQQGQSLIIKILR